MIQSNGSWLLRFQVSGKAPHFCWVTTKSDSGLCCGSSLMLAGLGGQQSFVQFNRIIPRIKTEIPASKASSEAAVPCVQGRIFADGVDKKVTWDVLCSVSSISSIHSPPRQAPSLTRPHHWQSPDTAQSRYWALFLAGIKNLKPPNINFVHLHSFLHHTSLDDWSWSTESIKCTQIAVMTISELRRHQAWRRCLLSSRCLRSGWYSCSVLSSVISISQRAAHIHHPSTCTDLTFHSELEQKRDGENNNSYSVINMWCADVLLDTDRSYLHHKMDLTGWLAQSYRWWAESLLCSCKHQDNGDNDGDPPANKHDENREDHDQTTENNNTGNWREIVEDRFAIIILRSQASKMDFTC